METFADKVTEYFSNLKSDGPLPPGIHTVNPYKDQRVKKIVQAFYKKYFDDENERNFIFGINPGRFGGGLTGISFTDPAALRDYCGIENDLGTKRELSSKFIYQVIERYGGPQKFYSRYFLTALFPLALLNNQNNFNYYDDPALLNALKPSMESSFLSQTAFGASRDAAFCLGNKNYKYLKEINDKYKYFVTIKVLHHPRYIMQYRLKSLENYITEYLKNFK